MCCVGCKPSAVQPPRFRTVPPEDNSVLAEPCGGNHDLLCIMLVSRWMGKCRVPDQACWVLLCTATYCTEESTEERERHKHKQGLCRMKVVLTGFFVCLFFFCEVRNPFAWWKYLDFTGCFISLIFGFFFTWELMLLSSVSAECDKPLELSWPAKEDAS